MHEAHAENIEVFGSLSYAALADIAFALTTYRREQEYVDATFLPAHCGRVGTVPLDWAALLLQVSSTINAELSRKSHAFKCLNYTDSIATSKVTVVAVVVCGHNRPAF